MTDLAAIGVLMLAGLLVYAALWLWSEYDQWRARGGVSRAEYDRQIDAWYAAQERDRAAWAAELAAYRAQKEAHK